MHEVNCKPRRMFSIATSIIVRKTVFEMPKRAKKIIELKWCTNERLYFDEKDILKVRRGKP